MPDVRGLLLLVFPRLLLRLLPTSTSSSSVRPFNRSPPPMEQPESVLVPLPLKRLRLGELGHEILEPDILRAVEKDFFELAVHMPDSRR